MVGTLDLGCNTATVTVPSHAMRLAGTELNQELPGDSSPLLRMRLMGAGLSQVLTPLW